MTKQKKWYIIHTLPRFEKKVFTQLQTLGIESYVPLNRVTHRWADRVKNVYQPLFPGYVFVHLATPDMNAFSTLKGVLGYVFWLTEPVIVSNEELDSIRQLLNEYTNLKVEKTKVERNEKLRLLNKKNQIQVTFPTLGYKLIARIERMSQPSINIPQHQDNLVLYFDTETLSTNEIANTIILLSEIYKSIGGDKIEIKKSYIPTLTQKSVSSLI